MLDELLDGSLLAAMGYECGVAVLNDQQVLHADRGDEMARIGGDPAAFRLETPMSPQNRISPRPPFDPPRPGPRRPWGGGRGGGLPARGGWSHSRWPGRSEECQW